MSLEKPIASKLFIKENYSILLLGEPEGYLVSLGKLPKNVSFVPKPSGQVDFI